MLKSNRVNHQIYKYHFVTIEHTKQRNGEQKWHFLQKGKRKKRIQQ